MKKPLSILAIAIIISAQLALSASRTFADDAPAPAPADPAPAVSAPAPAPDPAPADPAPAPAPSSDPAPASTDPSAPSDATPSDANASAAASPSDPAPTGSTDILPGPPAGGGPIDAPADDTTASSSDPAPSDPIAESTAVASSSDPIATSTPNAPDQDATTTPPIATTTPDTATTTDTTATTTASISNAATTTTAVISDASSGNNSATSTDDATTTIDTGDAVATANVVNVVNVNLFDSSALIEFLNSLSAGDTSIDLGSSAFDSDGSIGCSGCSVSTSTGAAPSSGSISATDTASINNTAIVRAETGGNSANGGDANITTGNAYAAANVATLANVNLVDSRYVMLVLNSFGSWAGDLVLPGASFWESFLNPAPSGNASSTSLTAVSVANAADIATNATTSADTGSNTASSTDGAAAVQTGSADSEANAISDVNQTHIGGATVDIIFHIFGNWTGHTLNLPPGFTAIQTPDGLEIVASNAGQSTVAQGASALSAANSASIANNLDVSASTGGNSANGANAGVSTGNAYASANSLTAANVTSISHNWLAAIVNVFGDWNGDIAFGAPDLWVGIRADTPDGAVGPGNHIVYHYTVKNMGDSAAHDVHLARAIGSNALDTDQPGVWDLGTLAPGDVRELSETVAVDQNVGVIGQVSVSNSIRATEDETDAHPDDNSDVISLVVGYPTYVGGGNGTPGPLPSFTITKTSDATTTIVASSTVDYTINLMNNGGFADHAVVNDQITDPNGAVIHSESWDLGSVKPDEGITLTYTALFSASSSPGVYTNSAQVVSVDNQFDSSAVASTTVTIAGSAAAPVVGPSTAAPSSSSDDVSLASAPSVDMSRYMTDATSTVRRPLALGFLTQEPPLPPDAGGNIIPDKDQSQIAAVGDIAMSPYAWSLYLLVLAAGGYYLVYKRGDMGWETEQKEKLS